MTRRTGRQLAMRWTIVAMSAVISALAIYASVRLAEPPVYHDVPIGSGAVEDPDALSRPIGLPRDAADLQQLTRRPGSQPLEREPANLPDPPGGENLLRYREVYPDATREQSIWTIPDADLAFATSYYQQQAEDRGFVMIDHRSSPTPRIETLRFTRDREHLLIRARQVGPSVRLVVQLRYTTAD